MIRERRIAIDGRTPFRCTGCGALAVDDSEPSQVSAKDLRLGAARDHQ